MALQSSGESHSAWQCLHWCAFGACFSTGVLLFVAAAIDTNANGTVERSEFADFIFHLAVAELKSTQAASLSELEE